MSSFLETQIELGVNGSRLNEGVTVNALQNSTTIDLYFKYEKGIWADTLPNTVTVGPEVDGPEVIADTTVSPTNRECAGTANAIETLVGNITTIINSGLGTVTRQEQTVNTALLASETRSSQLTLLVLVLTHTTLKLVHQSDLYHALVLIRQQVDMLMLTSVLLDYLTDLRPTEHTM
ncbi:MAG: hypothetical protein CM15mV3_2780 [Caudoviricetes sp.]|nr:MAG: hypothetical protein CM15mV3_2780 [Caudoviricetes sp.]